jgi:hypothetical protein
MGHNSNEAHIAGFTANALKVPDDCTCKAPTALTDSERTLMNQTCFLRTVFGDLTDPLNSCSART